MEFDGKRHGLSRNDGLIGNSAGSQFKTKDRKRVFLLRNECSGSIGDFGIRGINDGLHALFQKTKPVR